MNREREKTEFGALLALLCGALSTGAAGILVRLAEDRTYGDGVLARLPGVAISGPLGAV